MPTIFTKIIGGEIPCHKVMETEEYLAFLDIRPIRRGHTLVIPKKEEDYIFDMDDQDLAGLMAFAKQVAFKIRGAIPCRKVGVMVCGIEVPHAHIHLLPVDAVTDMNFALARDGDPEELARTAELIRNQ